MRVMDPLLASLTIVSVLLIITVILQNQGGGWATTLGAQSSYHTKRGIERTLFYATIVLGIGFALLSILTLIR